VLRTSYGETQLADALTAAWKRLGELAQSEWSLQERNTMIEIGRLLKQAEALGSVKDDTICDTLLEDISQYGDTVVDVSLLRTALWSRVSRIARDLTRTLHPHPTAEGDIRSKFKRLYLSDCATAFAYDLANIHEREIVDDRQLALVLDCVEAGADFFSSLEQELVVKGFSHQKAKRRLRTRDDTALFFKRLPKKAAEVTVDEGSKESEVSQPKRKQAAAPESGDVKEKITKKQERGEAEASSTLQEESTQKKEQRKKKKTSEQEQAEGIQDKEKKRKQEQEQEQEQEVVKKKGKNSKKAVEEVGLEKSRTPRKTSQSDGASAQRIRKKLKEA